MMVTRNRLRRLPLFATLLVPLFLAACSGGGDEPQLELQVINAGRAAIAAKTAPKVTRPPLTRAALDTLEGSFVEVILERRDQLAYLHVGGQMRDSDPGVITIWRTDDNITLSMRNGVLVATRGLGGDILSSTVQVAGDSPGPSGGGEKIFYIRALENKKQRIALVCDLVDLGPQTIEIVGRRDATRHVQERCVGGRAADGSGDVGEVINDYWVDSRTGLVLQSRQWAGPITGYLRLRRLTY
jgi:group 4 capsule polysaccharide lipoprotein GfcB/YjbF